MAFWTLEAINDTVAYHVHINDINISFVVVVVVDLALRRVHLSGTDSRLFCFSFPFYRNDVIHSRKALALDDVNINNKK